MTFWMKRLLEIPWLVQLEAPTRNDHHYSAYGVQEARETAGQTGQALGRT
jgi:hypothetical protein